MDASYYSDRCLPEFVGEISQAHKPIALADIAMANGADNELMEMLREQHLLDRLSSYAAWNTAANSAGTCIAYMMLRLGQTEAANTFTKLRLLEDWAYMANVRKQALAWITQRGGGYFNLGEYEASLGEYIGQELQRYADECGLAVRVGRIGFPWRRLFDISIDLEA